MNPVMLSNGYREYVTGQPSTEYVSDETPMSAYGNVHLALEAMRVRALDKAKSSGSGNANAYNADSSGVEPPRVLILGPENSGKTTLAKILLNYATRTAQNRCPMFVNVDPSEVRYLLFLFSHTFSRHPYITGRFYAAGDDLCCSDSVTATNLDSGAHTRTRCRNGADAYGV